MRKFPLFALLLYLWCGPGFAGMFGDFLLPDSLRPEPQATPGHNNRAAVIVQPPEGTKFVLYLPTAGQNVRPQSQLQAISGQLASAGEIVVFNMGGRPWFGARQLMPDGVAFFDGFTHRDGLIYNVAFSMNGMTVPDTNVVWALSQIWVLPGLNGSPAAPHVAAAINMMDTAELPDIQNALNSAMAADPSNWVAPYLLGRFDESQEEIEKARDRYRQALALHQNSTELAARAASMESMVGDANSAINHLFDIADSDPDEATLWEELGRIYLAGEDTETAQSFFEQAIAANPSDEIALYNLSFIYAQHQDYDNALRRTREFMHYYPWMPKGVVPDVTGAPELAGGKATQILSEPLPVGSVSAYASLSSPAPTSQQIAEYTQMIQVPVEVPVEVPVPYEVHVPYEVPVAVPVYEVYSPVVIFDWGWSPRRYGYWRPGWDDWGRRPPPPRWRRPPPPHWDRPGPGWSGGIIGPGRDPWHHRPPPHKGRPMGPGFRPPPPPSRHDRNRGRRSDFKPPAPPKRDIKVPGGRRVTPADRRRPDRPAGPQRPDRPGVRPAPTPARRPSTPQPPRVDDRTRRAQPGTRERPALPSPRERQRPEQRPTPAARPTERPATPDSRPRLPTPRERPTPDRRREQPQRQAPQPQPQQRQQPQRQQPQPQRPQPQRQQPQRQQPQPQPQRQQPQPQRQQPQPQPQRQQPQRQQPQRPERQARPERQTRERPQQRQQQNTEEQQSRGRRR